MDDETAALFVLALKLRQYSDSETMMLINTKPLRDILESISEDAPDSCESSDRPH